MSEMQSDAMVWRRKRGKLGTEGRCGRRRADLPHEEEEDIDPRKLQLRDGQHARESSLRVNVLLPCVGILQREQLRNKGTHAC